MLDNDYAYPNVMGCTSKFGAGYSWQKIWTQIDVLRAAVLAVCI